MPNENEHIKDDRKNDNAGEQDMERLLESREKIDALFHDKFTKVITVMFTDLKGSTALADKQGDIVSRLLVKHYHDIIVPAITRNNGIFIKSIGDGTLSYFEHAQDALRAGAQLQKGIDEYITGGKTKTPILARVGMHTGRCIIEKSDIFGDVVNTASRFESTADAGGIALSEDTYNALSDKDEIICKYVKTTTLKGKQDQFKVFKAFWNPDEARTELVQDTSTTLPGAAREKQPPSTGKIIMAAVIVGILLALILGGSGLMNMFRSAGDKRTVQHGTDSPAPPVR